MEETKKNKGKDEKSSHSDTIIRNHVIWSMGAGFIPILVADIFAVSALQLDMIRQLARVYEVDFSETRGKAIVTSLTGSTLARLGAGSLVKLVPGIGSVLGGVTVSVFAGASTYALGEVFKKHFASGGTILDFDPARVRKIYQEKFEKGKKVVREWNKEAKKDGPVPPPPSESGASNSAHTGAEEASRKASTGDSLIANLERLQELKQAGVLTEDEFQKLKKALIDPS